MTKETAEKSLKEYLHYSGKWVKSKTNGMEFEVGEIKIEEIGQGDYRFEIMAEMVNTNPIIKVKASELPVNWSMI